MLLNMAFRNIYRSIWYYFFFSLTLTMFAILLYSTISVRVDLTAYVPAFYVYDENITNIEGAFYFIQYATAAIVIIFAIYVTRFFVQRRGEEIALYKNLGMSKIRILFLFMIENLIVIAVTFIIALIFSLFCSRYVFMLSIKFLNIVPENMNISLHWSGAALQFMGISLLIIWAILSLFSIKDIYRVTFASMKKPQLVSKLKFPYVSLSGFIVSVVLLITYLYKSYTIDPINIDIGTLWIVFVLANIVVIFLYRSIINTIFFILKKKKGQLKSPKLLLTTNHLIHNLKRTNKLLSFITSLSAIIMVVNIIIFSLLNYVGLEQIAINNEAMYIVEDTRNLAAVEKEIDMITIPVAVQTVGDAKELIMTTQNFTTIITHLIKEPQQQEALLSTLQLKLLQQPNILYVDLTDNDTSDVENYEIANLFSFYLGGTQIIDLRIIRDEDNILPQYQSLPQQTLMMTKQLFYQRNYIKAVQILNHISDLFPSALVMISSNFYSEIALQLFVGQFRIIGFLLLLAILLALVMIVFFKALEMFEQNLEDYIIAKHFGMPHSDILKAIIQETSMLQLLPFYVGLIGGGFVFISCFNFSLIPFIDSFDFIANSTTIANIIGIIFFIHLLNMLLIYILYQKVITEK